MSTLIKARQIPSQRGVRTRSTVLFDLQESHHSSSCQIIPLTQESNDMKAEPVLPMSEQKNISPQSEPINFYNYHDRLNSSSKKKKQSQYSTQTIQQQEQEEVVQCVITKKQNDEQLKENVSNSNSNSLGSKFNHWFMNHQKINNAATSISMQQSQQHPYNKKAPSHNNKEHNNSNNNNNNNNNIQNKNCAMLEKSCLSLKTGVTFTSEMDFDWLSDIHFLQQNNSIISLEGQNQMQNQSNSNKNRTSRQKLLQELQLKLRSYKCELSSSVQLGLCQTSEGRIAMHIQSLQNAWSIFLNNNNSQQYQNFYILSSLNNFAILFCHHQKRSFAIVYSKNRHLRKALEKEDIDYIDSQNYTPQLHKRRPSVQLFQSKQSAQNQTTMHNEDDDVIEIAKPKIITSAPLQPGEELLILQRLNVGLLFNYLIQLIITQSSSNNRESFTLIAPFKFLNSQECFPFKAFYGSVNLANGDQTIYNYNSNSNVLSDTNQQNNSNSLSQHNNLSNANPITNLKDECSKHSVISHNSFLDLSMFNEMNADPCNNNNQNNMRRLYQIKFEGVLYTAQLKEFYQLVRKGQKNNCFVQVQELDMTSLFSSKNLLDQIISNK